MVSKFRKSPPVCFGISLGRLIAGKLRFSKQYIKKSIKMKDGQEIRIKRAKSKIKLIKLDGGSFYEILRTKLHWGARPLFNA